MVFSRRFHIIEEPDNFLLSLVFFFVVASSLRHMYRNGETWYMVTLWSFMIQKFKDPNTGTVMLRGHLLEHRR